jgi:hypothetical protein
MRDLPLAGLGIALKKLGPRGPAGKLYLEYILFQNGRARQPAVKLSAFWHGSFGAI